MRRGTLIFAGLALIAAFALTRGLVAQPGFTDAFYHFNTATRLARGEGLTDPYLWTYIGAPDHLPVPSHLYWMPLTSLLSGASMALLGAPGSYAAAQLPLTLMFAGTALVGFWLGGKIGGRRRHAWVAGLLTLFSGYYTRFWGATDTFAPYALIGSLCLVALGLAVERLSESRRAYGWCVAAGVLAALAHLTRADGVLLLGVGWVVVALTPAPLPGGRGEKAFLREAGRLLPPDHIRRSSIVVSRLLAGFGSFAGWLLASGRTPGAQSAGLRGIVESRLKPARRLDLSRFVGSSSWRADLPIPSRLQPGWVLVAGGLPASGGAAASLMATAPDSTSGEIERRKEGSAATHRGSNWKQRLLCFVLMTLAYLAVMAPWFARNLSVIGAPLPVGGTQGIWFTEYNDLFAYPPRATAASFFATGLQHVLATRWEALSNNLLRFVAEQGMIVLTPLMLVGLWTRRRAPFVRAFGLYALGLFAAMTFIFAYPGYRGGLFHSAAALVPWWAALGVAGLDTVVEWAARKRRRWHAGTAKAVFSVALVLTGVLLSLTTGLNGRVSAGTPPLYTALKAALPEDARVMINDPAALYYFTGIGGVVLPNEAPDVIPVIARQYDVGYLLLEAPSATPAPLWPLFESTPPFLTPIPLAIPNVRLYAITPS